MIKAKISPIKWNTSVENLIQKQILGKDTMEFAAITAKEIMNPFVPMDTGNLSNDENATVKKDPVNIIAGDTIAAIHYTARYGIFVYKNARGVKFRKTHHRLATEKWDRAAMQIHKDKLIRDVQEFIRKKRGI